MDAKKGLRELVEAAAALHRDRPGLQVYLVGEGPDRPLLSAAIEAAGAGSYIHALRGCAPDDVAVWMTAADLVTLPSYMEGCPNVILEALACGRPVVATEVGGIPEILTAECGRLVAPRNPAALAEALRTVLDADWDAAALSASRSRSWSAVAAEILEIFAQLVSARRRRAG
jgi:glycosyltransferase involved in cell wall biosynthesis